jgi:predicted site-specific integrase-resolvase
MQTVKRAEPIKQVAASYGASYDTFYRAAKDGRLKVIWLANRMYVPADEIERLSREGLRPAGEEAR